MFVSALARYASFLSGRLSEYAFEDRPIRFVILLDDDGRPTVQDHVEANGKKKPKAKTRMICRTPRPRGSRIVPLAGADNMAHLFGAHTWSPDKQRDWHDRVNQATYDVAKSAGVAALQPYLKLMENEAHLQAARKQLEKAGAKHDTLAALADADGNFVVDDPEFREWWVSYYDSQTEDTLCRPRQSCITGEIVRPPKTHPRVSQVPGAQSRSALVSFNESAFCHHGWEQSENAPMSRKTAAAYVAALNDLLIPGVHRLGDSDIECRTRFSMKKDETVTYLFWMDAPAEMDVISLVEMPGNEVEEQIDRIFEGGGEDAEFSNHYHFLGLRGNGGRCMVDSYQSGHLPELQRRLRDYFACISAPSIYLHGFDPVPMWRLLRVLQVGGNVKEWRAVLIRRAMLGMKTPFAVGSRAVSYLSKGKENRGSSRTRRDWHAAAALCRLFLSDNGGEVESYGTYWLGRILARMEDIQKKAAKHSGQRLPSRTIVDGAFVMMLTAPQVGLTMAERLSSVHRSKLRRRAPQLERWIGERISDYATNVAELGLPTTPLPQDSAALAVGLQHERGKITRYARERAAEKLGITVEELRAMPYEDYLAAVKAKDIAPEELELNEEDIEDEDAAQ